MPLDIAQQEQEQKRKLWHQQQAAKMSSRLSEQPATGDSESPSTAETVADSSSKTELPQGRSPKAIAARLRAERAKESKAAGTAGAASEAAGAAGAVPGGEAIAKIKQTQEAVQRLKNLYRIINGAAGITLVGLIVTFIVMNGQLILGNWLKAKLVPALSLPEIIIVLIVDLILLAAFLVIFVLFSIVVMAYDWETWKTVIGMLPGIAWDAFRSLF